MGHLSGLQEFLDEHNMNRMEFEDIFGESADNYEGLSYWEVVQEVMCDDACSHEAMYGGCV